MVVVLPLLHQHVNLQAPPLYSQLKPWLHSQKETRQQQSLCPHHLRRYPRMLPVVKIRLLHLYLPLPPPPLHLLLSPLHLCQPVQPSKFHHRHLRQKQVFSLLHPQPHPRPNRQLRFLHAALSARSRSTRRRLCLSCLYHLHCWETLRTGEYPPPGIQTYIGH